jgi:hypothetical protein
MAGTRTTDFLRSKQLIRNHPDWTDEQVAEALGIPRADIDLTVAVARQEVETAG